MISLPRSLVPDHRANVTAAILQNHEMVRIPRTPQRLSMVITKLVIQEFLVVAGSASLDGVAILTRVYHGRPLAGRNGRISGAWIWALQKHPITSMARVSLERIRGCRVSIFVSALCIVSSQDRRTVLPRNFCFSVHHGRNCRVERTGVFPLAIAIFNCCRSGERPACGLDR